MVVPGKAQRCIGDGPRKYTGSEYGPEGSLGGWEEAKAQTTALPVVCREESRATHLCSASDHNQVPFPS